MGSEWNLSRLPLLGCQVSVVETDMLAHQCDVLMKHGSLQYA